MINTRNFAIASIIAITSANVKAQQILTIDAALRQSIANNKSLAASALELESQRQLRNASVDLPKTSINLLYGQYNSLAKDNNITVTQSIPFPTTFSAQGRLNRSLVASAELRRSMTQNELVYRVKQVYTQMAYIQSRRSFLQRQDSLYQGFVKSATLRFETGEGNLLEKVTAETQRNENQNLIRQSEANRTIYLTELRTLMNSDILPDVQVNELVELPYEINYDSTAISANPALGFVRQQVEVAGNEKKLATARLLPDFTIGFFSQTLTGFQRINGQDQFFGTEKRFKGIQAGVSIPLWFLPHTSRIRSAEFARQAAARTYEYNQMNFHGQYEAAIQEYVKNKNSLEYYKTSALPNAQLILRQSQLAYNNGEVGFNEFLLGLQRAAAIREGYLQALHDFNQSAIYLQYLTGNNQ